MEWYFGIRGTPAWHGYLGAGDLGTSIVRHCTLGTRQGSRVQNGRCGYAPMCAR